MSCFVSERRRARTAAISPVAARISVVGSGTSPASAVNGVMPWFGMLNGNGAIEKTIPR